MILKTNHGMPMHRSIFILPAILLLAGLFLLEGCKPGNRHGFRLTEKRFVKEINAECLVFEHEKSGARLMKIQADDPNKTFCITFRTMAESDNGLPHIMEHSVLNGSKNFPVKSPFDEMSKGSLNTFLNAFTSKDFTMYPVASMNDKDYFNLMHVYLDAVFNPLIYSDPRILQQEGWHYELDDKAAPLKYNGVVYNEMKGSFSDPNEELSYQIFRAMFPDNGYGFESGGYPPAIPTLTQEEFLHYHEKYYHPENSYIVLYGNADLDKELEFIDREYLSKYTRTGNQPAIGDQPPFTGMKEVEASYPAMEGAPTEGQTYLAMNWVAGHGDDPALTMSLDILCDVLVNQESGPLRLALLEAGIGKEVTASASNFKQNLVQITVRNANTGDRQKFLDVVNATLKNVANNGLDKKEIEGVINRREFQLREGDNAQKGLIYAMQAMRGWFFRNDPYTGLEYEKPLAEVKTSLTTNYLENVIRKYFLDNPHALLISLEPKPGLEKEKTKQTEEALSAYKAGLDEQGLTKIITQTKELLEYQKREDKPEALATIPQLALSDIDPKATFYEAREIKEGPVPVLYYETFTNNVIYVNYYFDMRTLPRELIPYASLLSYMIGILDTDDHNWQELSRMTNIHLGGFYTDLTTFSENEDDRRMVPKFVFTTKVMPEKLPKLFEMSEEVIVRTRYNGKERMKSLLTRLYSNLEEQMKSNGYSVAANRASAMISARGMFREQTEGLDYYNFISGLSKNFDAKFPEISANLSKTARLLFTAKNLVCSVTCDGQTIGKVTKGIGAMVSKFGQDEPAFATWEFTPQKQQEGIPAASKVQYVVAGYNFRDLGYKWDGRMRVLSHILSTDYLQKSIRVIGGAYGGWSSFSSDGMALFNSYRDPNLSVTLENYHKAVDYLKNFKAAEKEMTRYIIGTVAGMDQPLTASAKGSQAVSNFFRKHTAADLQSDRDAVLATRPEDISGFAGLVKDVLDQNVYCVYGNEDRLKSEKNLFTRMVAIGQ